MTRRPELSLQRTKRSIVIAGHKTSLSLEAAFWGSLKEIAAHEGVSVVAALTRIVTTRTCHRQSGYTCWTTIAAWRRRSRVRRTSADAQVPSRQAVEYNPPRGTYVPSGTWIVTATLPERNGEYYYRIRHSGEPHERVVREGELSASPEDNLTKERRR